MAATIAGRYQLQLRTKSWIARFCFANTLGQGVVLAVTRELSDPPQASEGEQGMAKTDRSKPGRVVGQELTSQR
jgi:hypothetical protein